MPSFWIVAWTAPNPELAKAQREWQITFRNQSWTIRKNKLPEKDLHWNGAEFPTLKSRLKFDTPRPRSSLKRL
jgi:hypothetical protein